MPDKDRDVRAQVREQYEKFPYPGPEESLDRYLAQGSYQAGCPAHFFHWYWPFREQTQDLDILVAGCGTMQAPKIAAHVPGARVTAIDISQRSIEHTAGLLKRHAIHNVELREMPVEDVAGLGKQFDLVFCTGVLHHLPDPVTGLRALVNVLKPDGSMFLMLYGKYGRDGVYYLQDLFRRTGLTASGVTKEQIDQMISLIKMLPKTHPMIAKAGYFGNYMEYSAEMVDLFLHPRDRAYAIPDIYDLLDECDLTLQKLVLRAHYAPRCSDLARHPFYSRIMALPEREQFAIGELFRAATSMHFFIACPKTRAPATAVVNLDDANWKGLIPVKNPALEHDSGNFHGDCVRRVYWRGHMFPDIRTCLNAREARLLDLVDGVQNIGEIVRQAGNDSNGALPDGELHEFFVKMYDYDYLWFRG